MKRAVLFAAALCAALWAGTLPAYAESIDLSGNRVFVDFDRNSEKERSYPVELPEGGKLTINYWSNYFTDTPTERDRSSVRICSEKNETFWSKENIEKGSYVFETGLPAGQYSIVVSSETEDGRVTFELYYGSECIQGNWSAGSLEDLSPEDTLYLSGDTVLELDKDLMVKDIALLGTSECTLTLTGDKTLYLASPDAVRYPVKLIVRGGIVTAPALSGFILYDGEIDISGGSADSFTMYGGNLNVDSNGDGLTGAFEVNDGEIYVRADGCGIHTALHSGEARILGGRMTVRGEQRAALAEHLEDHMEGTDNLGYRLLRTEVPLCITSNVEIVEPSSGWIRNGKAQYTFPENVKEIVLCAFDEQGWIREGSGWWYKSKDGSRLQNQWILDDGLWYYLKDTGWMAAGETLEISGRYYHFTESGVCLDP